jgi:hypothetical protein
LGVGLLMAGLSARSEVIDIVWQDGARFDRTLTVAPGRFAELCGTLGAGNTVTWSFDADGVLDFNIHFHLGKDVRYPSLMDGVRGSQGILTVDIAQDYCWMWTNKSAAAAKLAVRLVLK